MTTPPSADIVNVFVTAVARVLRVSLGESARLAGLQRTRSIDPPPDIAIAIELSGSLRGPVTWVFSPRLARRIAVRLTMDDEVTPELVTDAVAELSNIVAGNVTGPLEDAGYSVQIAPPVVYDLSTRRALDDDTLVATLSAPSGTIRVFLGLQVAA